MVEHVSVLKCQTVTTTCLKTGKGFVKHVRVHQDIEAVSHFASHSVSMICACRRELYMIICDRAENNLKVLCGTNFNIVIICALPCLRNEGC